MSNRYDSVIFENGWVQLAWDDIKPGYKPVFQKLLEKAKGDKANQHLGSVKGYMAGVRYEAHQDDYRFWLWDKDYVKNHLSRKEMTRDQFIQGYQGKEPLVFFGHTKG